MVIVMREMGMMMRLCHVEWETELLETASLFVMQIYDFW